MMKKIHLFYLLAFSIVLFNSCQEKIEQEEIIQELTTLNQAPPIEDEDVSQFINDDEMLPKSAVTKDLLAEVETFYTTQVDQDVQLRNGTDACDGLGGMPVFCETFDDANVGSVAANSVYFEKWVPSAQNDGTIVSSLDGNILRIDRRIQSQTHALNEEDDILLLGDNNQGNYVLRFEMYIGNCRTAYFDLQKQLRQEVLAAFTFHKFGKGTIDLPNGGVSDFSYPVGQWFEVEIRFNVNNLPFNPTPPFNNIMIPNENTLTVAINGSQVADVSTEEALFNISGANSNNLQGLNFYPLFRSSKFYVDNICFSFLGDPAVDGGD